MKKLISNRAREILSVREKNTNLTFCSEKEILTLGKTDQKTYKNVEQRTKFVDDDAWSS